MRGGTKCGAALGMGAPGPFVTILRLFQPPQQLGWPEPFPGQHFPHHPVDLRPRDPGHLFPPKPVAGSAEKLRPAGTGPRGDASQPRCGSRTRPGLRRFSPSQTPFLYANGSLPRMPGSPTGYPPEHWTGSSGPTKKTHHTLLAGRIPVPAEGERGHIAGQQSRLSEYAHPTISPNPPKV